MNNRPIVVGLGELLWDVFPDSRRPGGAPANVAFQAEQLGCRGVVCSRLGADDLGDELVEFLVDHGIPVDWIQRDRRYPTGTVTVDTARVNHPTYVIHENVAWDHLQLDQPLKQLMLDAAAVCFGTLAQRSADSRRTIQHALSVTQPKCLTVYDVNLRQNWYNRRWIEESFTSAGVVKLNAEEAATLAVLLETGSRDPIDFARTVQGNFHVEMVCITRGERGCLLVGRDEIIDQSGIAVEVVDAVGAGDAFTAALIAGQLRGWPLAAQAEFANRVGALVASRPGAMPALGEEFAELMDGFP
jgi:fructokinase